MMPPFWTVWNPSRILDRKNYGVVTPNRTFA